MRSDSTVLSKITVIVALHCVVNCCFGASVFARWQAKNGAANTADIAISDWIAVERAYFIAFSMPNIALAGDRFEKWLCVSGKLSKTKSLSIVRRVGIV